MNQLVSTEGGIYPTVDAPRQSSDSVQNEVPRNNKKSDRSNPGFIIEIEGEDLKKRHYTDYIQKLYIEDTCDKIPIVKILFNNSEGRFTNEPLWEGNKKLRVYIVYPKLGVERKVGLFYTKPASYQFSNKKEIRIEGWGEELRLCLPEKRRVWATMTDSEIAQKIAEENGFKWKGNIDTTGEKFGQVSQANESDMNFLIRRARLYGYVVYVKFGSLHFHAPRYKQSGIVLKYRKEEATLGEFIVGTAIDYRATRFISSQIDPVTQDIFTVTGSDLKDDVSEVVTDPDATDMWDRLMTVDDLIPSNYLINEGHSQLQVNHQAFADARSRASRWVIKGEGSCTGFYELNAGDIVTIVGVGKWSGDYLLTKVAHSFDGGYHIYFDVTRTWIGKSGRTVLKEGQESVKIKKKSDESEPKPVNSVELVSG